MRPKCYKNCLRTRRVKSQVPEIYQGKNGVKNRNLKGRGQTCSPLSHLLLPLVTQPCFPEPWPQPRHTFQHRPVWMPKVARASWGRRKSKTGDFFKKLVLKDFKLIKDHKDIRMDSGNILDEAQIKNIWNRPLLLSLLQKRERVCMTLA